MLARDRLRILASCSGAVNLLRSICEQNEKCDQMEQGLVLLFLNPHNTSHIADLADLEARPRKPT